MSETASGLLTSVAKTALTTAVGSVVSRALAPKQKSQQASPIYISAPAPQPTPTPPTTQAEPKVSMPVPDDRMQYAKARQAASRQAARRGGRQSTILTAMDDVRLGG